MFIVIFAMALCAAWAPFAALICGLTARRMGLSAWRWAAAGALHSVLFFRPWLLLMRRMRGKPVDRGNVRFDLGFAYWLAAGALASLIVLLVTLFLDCISFIPLYGCSLPGFWVVAVLLGNIIGCALPMALGLRSASRADMRFWKRETDAELRAAVDMPNRSHAALFAWAWASVLVGGGVWYPLFWLAFFDR